MSFDVMLKKALEFHGHMCVGMILGARVTLAGLHELGIVDPMNNRDLIVYVEVDRCLTDAVQAITGCTLGHRRLKYADYGKFAATFVDNSKNQAVRVSVREEASKFIDRYSKKPSVSNDVLGSKEKEEMARMIEAYSIMPDKELLNVKRVSVMIPKHDLPGRPTSKKICAVCGERIFDGREIKSNKKIICRACA